jgi:hypothetical protein
VCLKQGTVYTAAEDMLALCCTVVRMQVDTYIRQLNGLPPREQQQQARAAAVAAPTDTADPSEGNARRNRGTVQAEQVRQQWLLHASGCYCTSVQVGSTWVRCEQLTATAWCAVDAHGLDCVA